MKKTKRILFSLLTVAALIAMIVCLIQFGMAVKYGELGRVIFYLSGALYAGLLMAIAIFQLRKKDK